VSSFTCSPLNKFRTAAHLGSVHNCTLLERSGPDLGSTEAGLHQWAMPSHWCIAVPAVRVRFRGGLSFACFASAQESSGCFVSSQSQNFFLCSQPVIHCTPVRPSKSFIQHICTLTDLLFDPGPGQLWSLWDSGVGVHGEVPTSAHDCAPVSGADVSGSGCLPVLVITVHVFVFIVLAYLDCSRLVTPLLFWPRHPCSYPWATAATEQMESLSSPGTLGALRRRIRSSISLGRYPVRSLSLRET
jgi:hypothetical protein